MNVLNPKMDCPRCEVPLFELLGANGVVIDHCGRCGGAWYDQGEFELAFKVDEPINLQKEGTRRLRSVGCPRCHRGLVEMNWPPESQIRVDHCPDCDGMWLDQGEAAQIKRALTRSGRITEVSDIPEIARTTRPLDTSIDDVVDRVRKAGLNGGRVATGFALMMVTQGAVLGFLLTIRMLRTVDDAAVAGDNAMALTGLLVSLPLAAAVYVRVVDHLDARELALAATLAALLFMPLSPLSVSPLAALGTFAMAGPLALLVGKLGQRL